MIEVDGFYGVVYVFVYFLMYFEVFVFDDELLLYVVLVYGGLMVYVIGVFLVVVVFFISWGIGVFDVNYGGFIGYGCVYWECLDG